MTAKLTSEHLSRRAIVYVRQSTPGQVQENRESQRRQYGLVERARELGFNHVDVVDDDLGRSGSGLKERPGFQRLVAEICAGTVGAVLCIEASRLAPNGRDWHYLVDFCGLVGAVVIDAEGIYDPRTPNDRLLLGLKGTMSEFELTLFRQRSFEAIRAKARRGELQFCLPIGLCWDSEGRVEIDPDQRVRGAIALVLKKFVELGSIRQAHLWLRQNAITLPTGTYGNAARKPVWKLPVYNAVHGIITNPVYAGAYAFGKTGDRTRIVGDRARKTRGHIKPRKEWTVLLPDHHPGYISWKDFERNQRMVADNAHMKKRAEPKAGRGGRGLLGGLLRCRRCGRMLHVTYAGLHSRVVRYACQGALLNHGTVRCISFGGLRVDEAIARTLLEAVSPYAIDAATKAAADAKGLFADQKRALAMELEQSRYEASLAARRYEAVDPTNRLVASELEQRWNAALARSQELENRLAMLDERDDARAPSPEGLKALSRDLPAAWNSPSADMKLKQRIVRLIVREIVADVDDAASEILLVVHWQGGRHTEMRIPKNKTGKHGRTTTAEAVDVIRSMAGRWPDELIATTLNRTGLRTGTGDTWNERKVYSVRHRLELPAYDPNSRKGVLTLGEAAEALEVSETLVRTLIRNGALAATQVVPGAPYEIDAELLNSKLLRRAVTDARRLGRVVRQRAVARRNLPLPGIE
jgi:DNA invertase Pin-like site-specific DNA recombinase